MPRISADYLVELVAIAREGSMSAAALELSTSQSALSRHVKALESALGLKVLNRVQGGIELTSAGRYICNRSGDIVDAVEDIEFYASEFRDEGIIVFGGMTIFPGVVRGIADDWKSRGSDFKPRALVPSSFSDNGIQDVLGRCKADVYLTLSYDDRLDYLGEYYEVLTVEETPIVAVMEPSHYLSSMASLALDDLSGQLLLHAQTEFDGERINWSDTKAILRAAGVDFRSKTCTLESESDLLSDLRSGIILLPMAYSGVGTLSSAGKIIKVVEGARKRIVAVCKKGSTAASLLSSVA